MNTGTGPKPHKSSTLIEAGREAEEARQRRKTRRTKTTPAALSDVALIDAQTCAQAADVSLAAWNRMVAEGAAPAPRIKQHRYVRWLLADVRAWLIERVRAGSMPQRPSTRKEAANATA